MEELAKQPYFKEIAQYHCELAQAALLKGEYATAATEIDTAYATYRGCARATLLAGDADAQRGNAAAAIAAWQKIETQNPAFLSLAADRFADAYRKLGDTEQGIRMLRNYQAQYPSLDLLNALFTLVLDHEGPDAAASLIKDELARNPTLLGLDRLLEAQLPGRARGAPARPGAGQGPGRAAHQAPGHVQVRQLWLQGQAILLALSGLPALGDVLAAADGDARWLRVIRDQKSEFRNRGAEKRERIQA